MPFEGVASIYICWFVLSCTLTDAGSMEVPWRFPARSRDLSWRLRTNKLNQQNQHVANMKPAWKQHGNSIIKPASVRVQDRITLELVSRRTVFPCFV